LKRVPSHVLGRLLSVGEESAPLVTAAPQVPPREVFRRFWPYTRGRRRWLVPLVLFGLSGPLVDVRESLAVVLQETLVFHGTVRENIAYGRPGATDAEIVAAARAADADDFIRLLPDGYDTMVGQRGRTLSGGQRQRLAIARAMIRDAPVLLLDEPTTGLDARSGLRVMDPLRRLMAGRTTVVISHNLLTVRDATRIVVLDHGRVLETGTHDDLLGRGGTYAGLHRLHAVPGPARAAGPLPGTVPS
jgi:ABC-type multidrug transport system ATPase subunit